MSLLTNVKLGEVNNLTDARFASGIGAKFISFNFNPEHPQYIDSEKLKEIAGWLQGPHLVGEWDNQGPEEIQHLSDELHLEYAQLNRFDVTCAQALKNLIIIQNIYLDNCATISEIISQVDGVRGCVKYFMLTFNNKAAQEKFLAAPANHLLLTEFCRDYPVFFNFQFNKENLLPIIEKYKPFGINLRGSSEIKPGFKDFDEMNELVELLENED